MLKNFRFYRKIKGGTWYKHSFTVDGYQLNLNSYNDFWSKYGKINRYTEVIKMETY